MTTSILIIYGAFVFFCGFLAGYMLEEKIMGYPPLRLTSLMPFGKHKRKQIEDLIYDEPGYITWCVENEVVEFDEEATKLMEKRKLI